MNLVMLVGSARKDSYNQKIAHIIRDLGKDKGLDMEILEIQNVPMFNQDIEEDSIESVENLRGKIRNADGIIFVTPEHNRSVPALLKNSIDWLSRVENVLLNKPVMIAGASPSALGTANAQAHLRGILNSPGIEMAILPGNEVYLSGIHEKLDDEGKLKDEKTKEFLGKTLDNFIGWVEKN